MVEGVVSCSTMCVLGVDFGVCVLTGLGVVVVVSWSRWSLFWRLGKAVAGALSRWERFLFNCVSDIVAASRLVPLSLV